MTHLDSNSYTTASPTRFFYMIIFLLSGNSVVGWYLSDLATNGRRLQYRISKKTFATIILSIAMVTMVVMSRNLSKLFLSSTLSLNFGREEGKNFGNLGSSVKLRPRPDFPL